MKPNETRSPQERLVAPGSPFELCSLGRRCVYRHAPRTLPELLQKIRRAATKMTLSTGDTHLTYSELSHRASAFAARLSAEWSIGPGVRLGIVIPNGLEWPVAFVAACMSGAVPVLIEPGLQRGAICQLLERTECRAVVVQSSLAEELRSFGDRTPTVLVEVVGWDGQIPQPVDPAPENIAIIACTSGTTTGRPKAVMLDHTGVITGLYNMMLGSALASARNAVRAPPPTPASIPTTLLSTPLSHVGGYSGFLLNCLGGGRLLIPTKWDTGEVLRAVEQEKVRSLSGATPRQVRELLRAPDAGGRLDSLRSLTFHGAAFQSGLLEEIAAVLPAATVGTGYGMTETNGSVCIAAGAELRQRPDVSGPLLPTVELALKDRSGEVVPPGREGEIWLRGAMLMRGYCTAPEPTAGTLIDGWLRTGDLGCLEESQFLRVLDRQDEFVECRGRRVPCGQIEGPIRGGLQADEVVALEVQGQLVLVIVPKPGDRLESAGLEERLRCLSPVVTGGDVRIVIREEVPRTLRGKIDRRALRSLVSKG